MKQLDVAYTGRQRINWSRIDLVNGPVFGRLKRRRAKAEGWQRFFVRPVSGHVLFCFLLKHTWLQTADDEAELSLENRENIQRGRTLCECACNVPCSWVMPSRNV